MNKYNRNELDMYLNQDIKKNDTIYSVCYKRTNNGIGYYNFYVIKNNFPIRKTYQIASALGYTYNNRHECLTTNGYENDVVYNLAYYLFKDESALKSCKI